MPVVFRSTQAGGSSEESVREIAAVFPAFFLGALKLCVVGIFFLGLLVLHQEKSYVGCIRNG